MISKFLLADATENQEELFVIHTETPRFFYSIEKEEIIWIEENIEDFYGTSDEIEIQNAVTKLISDGLDFYESEMEVLSEEDL